MPQCERTWNPGGWPYIKRCKLPATTRVRLYDLVPRPNDPHNIEETELDLCDAHSEEAAAQYPDNIHLVKHYEED